MASKKKSRALPPGIYPSNGKYLARISHQGQQVGREFLTLEEAVAWRYSMKADAKKGQFEALPRNRALKSQVTFADFAQSSIERRNLTDKTLYDYNLWMQRHLLPHFGELRMRQITVAKVNAWFNSMDKRHPTTRARVYEMLLTIFKHAIEEGVIDANPCRVRNGSRSQSTFVPEIPEPRIVFRLTEAMGSDTYRVMCQVAAWCGLRLGEQFALRRCDVRIKDGVPTHLLVRRSLTWVSKTPVMKGPKSRAGVRDVPIPWIIRPDLTAYLAQIPIDDQQLLFPAASDSNTPMRPATLYKVFYRARRNAGVPKLRWHDLRHFAATRFAIAGATTKELMTIIGHSTPNAAMRYQQVATGRPEDIADRVSADATRELEGPEQRATGA